MTDVSEIESAVGLISAARNYFEARLSMGESSIILSPGNGISGAGRKGSPGPLAELEKTVKNCTLCPLHKTRTQVVFGTGGLKTGVVFIGEAPGRDEDREGKPFVGRAGQLLTRIIEAIEFDRKDVYITNVIKCRPEGNRDPLPSEIQLCSPYLVEQLELLGPKVICTLGRFAAEVISGVRLSMAAYRSESLSYRGTPVVATYHPAALLRNPSLKKFVWEDVQKLKEIWKNS